MSTLISTYETKVYDVFPGLIFTKTEQEKTASQISLLLNLHEDKNRDKKFE